MTDYTKLVAALRCKRDDCEGCDLAFFDKDEGWICQYAAKDDDAADAIEDLLEVEKVQIFNPWHRVEEELPNDGEWAIFTNGKVVSVERFKEDAYNHFFPASEWFNFEDAIAWMPLPEPPKEDA